MPIRRKKKLGKVVEKELAHDLCTEYSVTYGYQVHKHTGRREQNCFFVCTVGIDVHVNT